MTWHCQFQLVAILFWIFQSSKTNPPSSPNHNYLVSTNPTVSVIEVFLHPHHPLSAPALPPAPTDRRSEAKSSEFPKAAISKNVIPPACSFQSQSWVSPWVFRSKPRKGCSKTFQKRSIPNQRYRWFFIPTPYKGGIITSFCVQYMFLDFKCSSWLRGWGWGIDRYIVYTFPWVSIWDYFTKRNGSPVPRG